MDAYRALLNNTVELFEVETQYYQYINESESDIHFKVTFDGKSEKFLCFIFALWFMTNG